MLDIETDEEKALYWKAFESGREKYYDGVKREVAKEFEKERKAILKAMESGGEKAVMKVLDGRKKDWIKLYTDIYVEVMQDFGDQTLGSMRKDLSGEMETKLFPKIFQVFTQAVQTFISNVVATKVVGVTNVTKQKIKNITSNAQAQGQSIGQVMKEIDKLYLDQIIPNRSEVIARTEVIGASNAGSSKAADQTGLKLTKEWLATPDDRTRDTHNKINGETVPKEKPYSNGLMFPGDPEGKAEEVIQCRCTEVYKRVKQPVPTRV